MTIPLAVSTTRIGAHQNPITLCQLKSRALPRSPERKSITALTVPPRPLPRPPQIEARDRQHQKRRVARAGDRARRRAVLTLDRQIAVPARDRSVERPRPRRARSEDVAGVRVDEDRSALPERDATPTRADRNRASRSSARRPARPVARAPGARRRPAWRPLAGGSTKRCDRSTILSTDCWNVSSVPVTDMIRMTMPATRPAVRCVQKRTVRSFMVVDSGSGSGLKAQGSSKPLSKWSKVFLSPEP